MEPQQYGDIMDAAFNVAEDYRPGGAAGLAVAIGKNPSTFHQELTERGTGKLGLRTAVKMTKRSNDLRILLTFARECGQMCLPLPESLEDGSADDCMRALSATSEEFAKLCSIVCASLGDDGEISKNEHDRITDEGARLVAKINGLLHAVAVRHAISAGGRAPVGRQA